MSVSPAVTRHEASIAIPPFDLARVRAEFPILRLKVNGKPLAYLDNAASSHTGPHHA